MGIPELTKEIQMYRSNKSNWEVSFKTKVKKERLAIAHLTCTKEEELTKSSEATK